MALGTEATASDSWGSEPKPEGLESHITPAGDGHGIVTKASSDRIFGPDGLGFAGTPWATLVSWLARNGISQQTGSRPNETNIRNCALGWGQGAFSSHAFNKDTGVDRGQLQKVLVHLQEIAAEQGDDKRRIDGSVLAAFVGSQLSRPYLTADGVKRLDGLAERLSSRFRSHIQWQALYTLCGHVGTDGLKQVTPELLASFFTSEVPFFASLAQRRKLLREGKLQPGEAQGPLCAVPASVDLAATDREYAKTKSALWMVSKILFYMLTGKTSRVPPLEASLSAPA